MRVVVLAVLLVTVAACADGSPDAEGEPLLVMAAASLNQVMPELIEAFERRSGTESTLVLGSSGNLAAQIEGGAPADVFFSADQATVARLDGQGLVRGRTARTYAIGTVAAAWGTNVPDLQSLRDLESPAYEVIALANPELAPYGAAAREAMQRIGVWDGVERRVVFGENVAQTLQYLLSGNADVALVARSLLGDSVPYLAVDPSLHAPILHSAAVLARTTHPSAETFLEFVRGSEGREILERHGFATDDP